MSFKQKGRLSDKINNIKLIIIDVDGVLTDGKMHMLAPGKEIKVFNIKDGSGIAMAHRAGFITAIISGRKDKIVQSWAQKQDIKEIFQGVFHKTDILEKLKKKYKLNNNQIAYIGDDMIDLPVLRQAGFSVAVADAAEDIRKEVDFVTHKAGGQGAVRELIELIIKSHNKWDKVTEVYFKK
jgi:3-deoxy-D-manno-octulosonate 8-phosphate phosphatase (KDO 8-P phosphatase)